MTQLEPDLRAVNDGRGSRLLRVAPTRATLRGRPTPPTAPLGAHPAFRQARQTLLNASIGFQRTKEPRRHPSPEKATPRQSAYVLKVREYRNQPKKGKICSSTNSNVNTTKDHCCAEEQPRPLQKC